MKAKITVLLVLVCALLSGCESLGWQTIGLRDALTPGVGTETTIHSY